MQYDTPKSKTGKTRIALVGTGIRGSNMWGKSLLKQFPAMIEMVALWDINTKRAKYIQSNVGINAPIYHSHNFEKMIKETKPDYVIVTTPDSFHAEYAIKAMELGCDAIVKNHWLRKVNKHKNYWTQRSEQKKNYYHF